MASHEEKVMPATEFAGTIFTSMFSFAVTVDPASHTAGASVDTTVTSALVKSGDQVLALPPATFTAGVAVVGCHTVVDGSFKVWTTNPSAGTIDPASASWTFVVLRR
jgi:hypothetical protein